MICRHSIVRLGLAAALLLGLLSSVCAQDGKETTINGQIKVGVHQFKLDNGKLYQFEVKAKDFNPNVLLLGSFIQNTADFFKDKNTFRGLYSPPSSKEYTIVVSPNVYGGTVKEGLLAYTLTLKTMQLNETPVLKKEDKLTAEDPKYAKSFRKTGHKVYPIKLTKGTTYIIDMVAAKSPGNNLDPYLYLENPMNNIAAQDDDGGGNLNARIMFRAYADGEHRIIASGLSQERGVGAFTLTVRTVKGEK